MIALPISVGEVPVSETAVPKAPIRVDLGCGPNKKPGHQGLDQYRFEGVDHVLSLGTERWPFADGSVEEAHSSHFVEHLTPAERCHFCNELCRVLVPGGKAEIVVPHWGSVRAYGDPTHQWPPISEMWFYYLDRTWRAANAPHTDKERWPLGYDCDFVATWGYSLHPSIQTRNQAFQEFALNHYREAAQDIHATLTKR